MSWYEYFHTQKDDYFEGIKTKQDFDGYLEKVNSYVDQRLLLENTNTTDSINLTLKYGDLKYEETISKQKDSI